MTYDFEEGELDVSMVEEYLVTRDPFTLGRAFIFDATPEGHDYWGKFAYRGKELTEEAEAKLRKMLKEHKV